MAPNKRAHAKALSSGVAVETAAQAASRRRQLERRDTHIAVDRIIQDKFPDWPLANIYVKVVGGKTFRQALTELKRAAKGDASKIGCTQLQLLAALYGPDQEAAEALNVIDKSQPLDSKLVEALKHAGTATCHLRGFPLGPDGLVRHFGRGEPTHAGRLAQVHDAVEPCKPQRHHQQHSVVHAVDQSRGH